MLKTMIVIISKTESLNYQEKAVSKKKIKGEENFISLQ
jgi:hypothetical protein